MTRTVALFTALRRGALPGDDRPGSDGLVRQQLHLLRCTAAIAATQLFEIGPTATSTSLAE